MNHRHNVFARLAFALGFAAAWGSGRVQASDETGRQIETLLQRTEAAAPSTRSSSTDAAASGTARL